MVCTQVPTLIIDVALQGCCYGFRRSPLLCTAHKCVHTTCRFATASLLCHGTVSYVLLLLLPPLSLLLLPL
jgi:hypothetical protein